MTDWRRKLSNFAVAPFKLDGLNWNGVEWYYQGSKFKKSNSAFYREFSLDSDSELSKDPLLAKVAGGKTGITHRKITIIDDDTGKEKKKREKLILRPKEITIDKDFFPMNRNKEEMEKALRAKFTQDPLSKEVLLATYGENGGMPAKLQHFIRGRPAEVWYILMKIRKELKDNEDMGGDEISVEQTTLEQGNTLDKDKEIETGGSSEEQISKSPNFNWKTGVYN